MANKGMSRSLKSRQIGLKQLFLLIDGASTTPAAGGLDATFVESVTDNGTGDYTIRLKLPAQASLIPISFVSVTPGVTFNVAAVDSQEVTVECLDDAGSAIDADFYMVVGFHEVKHVF